MPRDGGHTTTKNPHRIRNLAHLYRDRGYRWTEQDIELAWVCAVITDSAMSVPEISEQSGVSTHTLYSWLSGKTFSPYNKTVTAVLHACGVVRRGMTFDEDDIVRKKVDLTYASIPVERARIAA